ncbi:hypothetical protein AMJ85_06205 [candidate division BRC1 bacterium SM23_51]|nr:MAG: hypothetical protein AMJ85_06205 [candidate division BRC1 bacterium SM23_51]
MPKKVAVIGGGVGALSGAIHLARMGFRVQLFEQNQKLGGKMGEHVAVPYRFDTGPSLLTMPFVVDELFQLAGYDRSSSIEFIPNEPLCRYFFPDGTVLDASANGSRMRSAIAGISPADADAFDRFLKYAKRIYDLTSDVFLFSPFPEFRKLLPRLQLRKLFRIHQIDPFRTVHQAVCRFFNDPRLVQLFDRYATYSGSSPFRAPATLNIIPYVEYGFGGYYIKGGMYRLVDALAKVAAELGVEIHTSSRVDRILHDRQRVSGIAVEGEHLSADYVLCGSDVVVAHNQLIAGIARRREKLNRLEPSLSGMVFLWGVCKQHPQLKMHNLLFSGNYQKEFAEIFTKLRPPEDPTIYITITSRVDPEHAPPHGENWFVLLNMPSLAEGQNWAEETKRIRETVFCKLRRIGVDISSDVEVEKVYTPEDFHHLFASNRGSIYGISSNSRTTAFRRPPNRSRDIKGLFFAGGSTHPGGGIPLVILSGKLAAELIADAEGLRTPHPQ